MSLVVAVDAMGGDHGPSVVVPAAIGFVRKHSDVRLILVGDETAVRALLPADAATLAVAVHHASQVVDMDEAPARALRGKKDSSMRVAIDLVAAGQAQACVSAGNTGALMATARFVLHMLPGIERPAIVRALPTLRGETHVLDLGANTECSAEQLCEFAVMGAVLVEALGKRQNPSVGLLNIGSEATKGTDTVQRAAELIREKVFRLCGEEIPYAVAVQIDKFEAVGRLRRIYATILVDRDSHKAIVIGKGGEKLKAISTQAREDMERVFDGKVYLEVWVKVKGGWADDVRMLKSLGLD